MGGDFERTQDQSGRPNAISARYLIPNDAFSAPARNPEYSVCSGGARSPIRIAFRSDRAALVRLSGRFAPSTIGRNSRMFVHPGRDSGRTGMPSPLKNAEKTAFSPGVSGVRPPVSLTARNRRCSRGTPGGFPSGASRLEDKGGRRTAWGWRTLHRRVDSPQSARTRRDPLER